MFEIPDKIRESRDMEAAIITMELARSCNTEKDLFRVFVSKLEQAFGKQFPTIQCWDDIPPLRKKYLYTPTLGVFTAEIKI